MAGNHEEIRKSRDEAENWFSKPINERIPYLWPGTPDSKQGAETSSGKTRLRGNAGLDDRMSAITRHINGAQLKLSEEGVRRVLKGLYELDPMWYVNIHNTEQAHSFFEYYIANNMPWVYQSYGSEEPYVVPTE